MAKVTLRTGRVQLRLDHPRLNGIGVDEAFLLVTECTRRVLNRATILTPVDTGNLRAHNQMTVRKAPPGAVGWVYNDAEYAGAVHDGSGPYTIRARNAKALRFVVDGRVVFAKSVRHPGTRGRPWISRAAQEIAPALGFSFNRS